MFLLWLARLHGEPNRYRLLGLSNDAPEQASLPLSAIGRPHTTHHCRPNPLRTQISSRGRRCPILLHIQKVAPNEHLQNVIAAG
jgi:hypothetical protein